MRKIYISVIAVFVVSAFLFIISFFYLDKHNHRTFFYDIAVNGQYAGTVKVDKFTTEDKQVYKSTSTTPFRELVTETRVRLELDRNYIPENYQKELFANGSSELFCAQNKGGYFSLLIRSMSRFCYLEKMPVPKKFFIFEEDSPLTYLPILENYDFKRGRAQGFNSLIYLPGRRLPPIKRFVTLTSIRNEYLKIGRLKIKTENMLLKIKGLPPGNVWVAKSDKSLMMIDVPTMGLRITRSFAENELVPKAKPIVSEKYTSREITFTNRNKKLAGTLTVPNGEENFPAVLLVWGKGPQDRNYQGFFESLASELSNDGYCVLRFDKRGIGSSGGNASSVTQDNEFSDIAAAFAFLSSQKNVNPQKVSIIAHSDSALNALRLAAANSNVRSIVLMAPSVIMSPGDRETILRDRAAKEKWPDDYLKIALMQMKDTKEKARKTRHDWGFVLGKRCYFKNIRDEDLVKPADVMAKVNAPILILHGKNDSDVPVEFAGNLDKALASYGTMRHVITYFDYLGHFFGKLINDGVTKMHYQTDKAVSLAIKTWLDAQ